MRREGLIPGVLYGRGNAPHAICVAERELRRVLTGDHGTHAILDVVLEGQKTVHASILKDYQRDPIRGNLIHFDLHEVRLDRPIQASVTVELVGEPAGVTEGGVLSQVAREVTVEALPLEMPDRIELDVGGMAIGDSLRISDLPPLEAATYVDDPDTVVANVSLPTRVEEPEEMREDEEPGAEGVPAEQAPEGGSEAPAEPGADAAGSPGTVPG